MYCGHCGKKVLDDMRFCPFCGKEIVIPDQNEAFTNDEERKPKGRPVSIFDMDDDDEPEVSNDAPVNDGEPEETGTTEEFRPLDLMQDDDAEEEKAEEVVEETEDEPDVGADDTGSIRIVKPAIVSLEKNRAKNNTFTPVKETNPNELFLEDDDEFEETEEDEFDDEEFDIDDEESERGSFFDRHIRGFVALILLMVVIIVCLVFSMTSPGQKILARMNLAWKADAYAELGFEAYSSGSFEAGQKYFTKALSMDEDNYDYAHSAMVCAYKAEDMESVKTMMIRCAELDPGNEYGIRDEIRGVYPDAAKRPFEIETLLNDYESGDTGEDD